MVLVVLCQVTAATTVPEKMLRVVSQVHANRNVYVSAEVTRGRDCVDTGETKNEPVCASNGVRYLNEDMFKYHKCVIQATWDKTIELVDMKMCAEALQEDN